MTVRAGECSPEELYDRYGSMREHYTSAADQFEGLIGDALAEAELVPRSVKARSKDPLELFKKQKKKNYPDPFTDCPDIVGARVVLSLSSQKPAIRNMLDGFRGTEVFLVEDQTIDADPTKLKYKGLHLHIRNNDIRNADGTPIRCEVQVRTMAEDSWAETEHRYIYKGPGEIPSDVRRVFARLLVLVELFDQELAKGVEMVTSLADYDHIRFVRELEKTFAGLVEMPTDEELTIETLRTIEETGVASLDGMRTAVSQYLERNGEQVADIVKRHGPTSSEFDIRSGWIITQPESLLLLALLEQNEYNLSTHLRPTDLYEPTEVLALWSNHLGFIAD